MPRKRTPFGELIYNARINSGLTWKEFAAKCKTSGANICRWENGISIPSMKLADKVLKALGLTMTLGKAVRKNER